LKTMYLEKFWKDSCLEQALLLSKGNRFSKYRQRNTD